MRISTKPALIATDGPDCGLPSLESVLRLAPPMPAKTTRILLVDDEQPVQKLLTYPLEKEGYEVVHAFDGQQALIAFEKQPFDLVVLDIMLPRMDGLEVCRRLRAR